MMRAVPTRAIYAFLSSVVLLSACGRGETHSVVVAVSAPRTIMAESGGLGTVAAAVDLPVTIGFRAPVIAVNVRLGDHITKGQALLSLDPTSLTTNAQAFTVRLQQAQAALSRAEGQLILAQQKQPLTVPGLRAEVQALQSQVGLDQQLVNIAHGRSAAITSPIDGEVESVNVIPGQVAPAGRSLIEIVDYTRITITANLSVNDQADVNVGAPAEISFNSLPDFTLAGTVGAVAPGANNNGLSFQVLIDALNSPDHRARPGFQAYVRIKRAHQAAVAVPKIAVLNVGLDPTVFVIDGQQVAHRRQVAVGTSDGTSIEILHGLNPGERCVIAGNQSLDDGSKVVVARVES
jgi:RND family efflux transporter MFP subunit